MKRAWVWAGGGPALGTIIGVTDFFAARGLMDSFKVVSASCIGAWVAVVYYSRDAKDHEDRVNQTYEWFKPVFQPNDVHDLFPINRVFAPDLRGQMKARWNYLVDPKTLKAAVVPAEMMKVGMETIKFMMTPGKWLDESSVNLLALSWMGAHPVTRLMVGLEYRTAQTGGARLHYEDAPLLREVPISRLYKPECPEIRYNAINLSQQGRAELFTNRNDRHEMVDMRTLCACSALPSIFAPVQIGHDVYCEGATVDAVQFIQLLEDHPDLDEIWVVRIVAVEQVDVPKDQTEALANSFMIFAGSLGAANIELFRSHAAKLGWKGRVVEVPVPLVKWEWSEGNLETSRYLGAVAAEQAWKHYETGER